MLVGVYLQVTLHVERIHLAKYGIRSQPKKLACASEFRHPSAGYVRGVTLSELQRATDVVEPPYRRAA